MLSHSVVCYNPDTMAEGIWVKYHLVEQALDQMRQNVRSLHETQRELVRQFQIGATHIPRLLQLDKELLNMKRDIDDLKRQNSSEDRAQSRSDSINNNQERNIRQLQRDVEDLKQRLRRLESH